MQRALYAVGAFLSLAALWWLLRWNILSYAALLLAIYALFAVIGSHTDE
jgi:hypothetical protein